MTDIFLKAMVCPAFILLIYRLLLERQKMHGCARIFLLFGLAFSFVIPFFTLSVGSAVKDVPESLGAVIVQAAVARGEREFLPGRLLLLRASVLIAAGVYFVVMFVRLYRFIRHIRAFAVKAGSGQSIEHDGARLVLVEEDVPPHSFMRTIFLNRVQFDAGITGPAVLAHELAHVRQRHSIDILLIEGLLVIFWFNPILYFYRTAIRLNHEFLADDQAITCCKDIPAYQHLLLDQTWRQGALPFSSRLNYAITKKRFIMMTRHTSFRSAMLRMLAALPLVAITGVVFIGKAAAQEQAGPGQKKSIPVEIFSDTTASPKGTIRVNYRVSPKPLPRSHPTADQLKGWAEGRYGVWIDGVKVDNARLVDYSPADFDQVTVSKLLKNSLHYRDYAYQVDLMTKAYYQQYVEKAMTDTIRTVFIRAKAH